MCLKKSSSGRFWCSLETENHGFRGTYTFILKTGFSKARRANSWICKWLCSTYLHGTPFPCRTSHSSVGPQRPESWWCWRPGLQRHSASSVRSFFTHSANSPQARNLQGSAWSAVREGPDFSGYIAAQAEELVEIKGQRPEILAITPLWSDCPLVMTDWSEKWNAHFCLFKFMDTGENIFTHNIIVHKLSWASESARGLVRTQVPGPVLRVLEAEGLGWWLRICISKEVSGGLMHLEGTLGNQCIRELRLLFARFFK